MAKKWKSLTTSAICLSTFMLLSSCASQHNTAADAQASGAGVRIASSVAGEFAKLIPVYGGVLSTALTLTGDAAATSIEQAPLSDTADYNNTISFSPPAQVATQHVTPQSVSQKQIGAAGTDEIYITKSSAFYKLSHDLMATDRWLAVTPATVNPETITEIQAFTAISSCFMDKQTSNIYCNGG